MNKDKLTGPDAIKTSVGEAVDKASKSDVIELTSSKKAKKENESELVTKLSRTYKFEGKEYNEIDLTGLNDLSTLDLQQVEKMFYGDGNIAPINEMSIGYCMNVASRATNLPVELFEQLRANDAVRIKNTVSGFLLG